MTITNTVLAHLFHDFVNSKDPLTKDAIIRAMQEEAPSVNWRNMGEMARATSELWLAIFPGLGQVLQKQGNNNLQFQCSAKTNGYAMQFVFVHKKRPKSNEAGEKIPYGNLLHVSMNLE